MDTRKFTEMLNSFIVTASRKKHYNLLCFKLNHTNSWHDNYSFVHTGNKLIIISITRILLLGSQWCSFTRYLTVSKWPLAQATESGVSPALLTVSMEDHHRTLQRNSTDKHILFGSTCLLMRALIISRLPREHSRERGVSPASFTATVYIQANYGH